MTDDEHIKYYAKKRLNVIMRVLLTFLTTSWLTLPVFIFHWLVLRGLIKILVVLLLFMSVFMFLTVFTKAKVHKIFTMTAVYVPSSLTPSSTFYFSMQILSNNTNWKHSYCLVIYLDNLTLYLNVQELI